MIKGSQEYAAIRVGAETQLISSPLKFVKPSKSQTHEELVHELHVHQIELEMQNDALRKSQLALEASHDRYFELYEFAPVGYMILTHAGQISGINFTGATLLGVNRNKLLKRRFDFFIATDDQNQWHQYFNKTLKSRGNYNFELKMHKQDGTVFHAHLISQPTKFNDDERAIHITLVDNTEQKRKDEEKYKFKLLLLKLTRRELEVLELALSGLHNKDIAIRLDINQRTVENHRAKIHRKTGVDSLLIFSQLAASTGIPLTGNK